MEGTFNPYGTYIHSVALVYHTDWHCSVDSLSQEHLKYGNPLGPEIKPPIRQFVNLPPT